MGQSVFGDDEILVHPDEYLNVVGIGGTPRENSTILGGLGVDLVQKVGAYERVGAGA